MSNVSKLTTIISTIRKYSLEKIFLFGSTLRILITENKSDFLDVVVYENNYDIQNKILLENIPGVNFIFDTKIEYSHELYTMDTIFAELTDDFNGNVELQSTNFGVMDINKRIIKLTSAGKEKLLNSPHFILDLITTVSNNKFIIDSNTITLLLNHRQVVKNIDSNKIYEFLKNISKTKRPRKIVSLLNALGISNELFGVCLNETAVINHLNNDDWYESLSVIFTNIEKEKLDGILLKIGFPPKDIDIIKTINLAIDSIQEETAENARSILKTIPPNRVISFYRLLNAMKFKTLAKFVKYQRESTTPTITKLCLTEDIIKDSFKITDEEEIKKLLDMALEKVILDPTCNDVYTLLSFLNQERN